jgi:hypothetical protein
MGVVLLSCTIKTELTLAWTRTLLSNERSKGVLAFKPESCPHPAWAVFTIVTAGRKRRKLATLNFDDPQASNGPITYELDGTQYVVVGAGDSLFGFVMLSGK